MAERDDELARADTTPAALEGELLGELPEDFTTMNACLVGAQGEDLVLLNPPRRLTRTGALNLVAWLAALATPSLRAEEIAAARRAVENS